MVERSILTPEERVAIEDLQRRYAAALDACDWDLFASCWTPDAVATYFDKTFEGRDAIVAFVRPYLDGLDAAHHFVGNHSAYRVDGKIHASCYFIATHVLGGRISRTGGRYLDDVVPSSGGLRLARRVEHADWHEGERAIMTEAFVRGTTGRRAFRQRA